MALERQDMRKLVQYRERYSQGTAALVLGDCQLHFSRGYLAELVPAARLDDSGAPATLADVGRALGFQTIDTVDLFGKPTIRFDLHSDSPPSGMLAKYDWVIDAGTAYCCFNVAAVLKNMLAFLKPQGCVYQHASLVGHLGRGYYSFSPMFFSDFYRQNDFEIAEVCVRVKPPREPTAEGLIGRMCRAFKPRHAVNEDWRVLGPRDFFVASADRDHIEFADAYRAPEPDILPNNALVMCFAQRRVASAFRNAIPEFFNK